MKDPESLAARDFQYDDVLLENVTYNMSGVHVPTDIYDKGNVPVVLL